MDIAATACDDPALSMSQRTARAVASAALVALVFVVYAGVWRFQFVNWDDPAYVTANPHLAGGLTWPNIVWAVTTGYTPYWHPVTWLSHLLDVQLYGLNPGGHHLTSLIVHAINSVLLFLLLRRLTGAAGRSVFVAAVFAVHPLHVESVAWVTERKDVLSGAFFILTIWAYAAYRAKGGAVRYGAVIAGFALALMSKPMVVTLPMVLLLLDWWPLRAEAPPYGRLLAKLPLLAMSVATGIGTVIIQKQVGAVPGLGALSLGFRVENALVSYVAYLGKCLWPWPLSPMYLLEPQPMWKVAAAGVVLMGLSVAAVLLRRRAPYVFVGWFWYLVTITPVIGFVQAGEQAMADRFMYLPIVGLLIAIAWGAVDLGARARVPSAALGVVAAIVIAVLASVARVQAGIWEDSVALWQRAVAVDPANYRAVEKLGEAFRDAGDLAQARAQYARAIELLPSGSDLDRAVLHNDLGLLLAGQANPAAASTEFAAAVQADPEFADAHVNLANTLGALGRLAEAVPHLREAIRLQPDLADARNTLASALVLTGRPDEAAAEYEAALRLNPGLATAHVNYAALLIQQRKFDQAARHLEAALAIDPHLDAARQALEAIRRR